MTRLHVLAATGHHQANKERTNVCELLYSATDNFGYRLLSGYVKHFRYLQLCGNPV